MLFETAETYLREDDMVDCEGITAAGGVIALPDMPSREHESRSPVCTKESNSRIIPGRHDMPRLLLGVFTLILLAGSAFLAYAWRSEIAPIDPPDRAAFDRTQIERGRDLMAIGNCASCHTAEGGSILAGGRPFETPFGKIYAPNITPDPETGIGRWSQAAFQRSMREGVDREGRHLYPAFPYDHFTLVTDEDNRALYAFLMSRRPVKAETPANDLPFPFNIRMTVAGWKLLYFKQGVYKPDSARSAEWNQGAYLAEGLAHCGACHTPRNQLGAEKPDEHFNGAEIGGWYAYAINSRSTAPVVWTPDALTFYLRNGWHDAHGMARGSMAPVAENLATVPEEDVRAIANYIGAMTQQAAPSGNIGKAPPPKTKNLTSADSLKSPPSAAAEGAGETGGQIYAAACASCHESGRPLPFGGIDLALSTAIHGASPRNLINVTLYGLPGTAGEQSPIMPGFAGSLTEQQIEALVIYLRSRFTQRPVWPDVAEIIREARNSDTAPDLYFSPGMQAAPADPSQGGVAW